MKKTLTLLAFLAVRLSAQVAGGALFGGGGSAVVPPNRSCQATVSDTGCTINHNLNTLNTIIQCLSNAGVVQTFTATSETVNSTVLAFAGFDGRCTVNGTGGVGSTGPQGPLGLQGLQGISGPQGTSGPQGPLGPAGALGPPGPDGPIGQAGARGPIGVTGPIGAQGAQGMTGPSGKDAGKYPVVFSGQSSITVTAASHLFVNPRISVSCQDSNNSGAVPADLVVDDNSASPTYLSTLIDFKQPFFGKCYLDGTAAVEGAGGASAFSAITGLPTDNTALANALSGKEPANVNIQAHISSAANPHSVTAAQVGAIPTADKGIPSGVATLDAGAKVPIAQVPTGTSSTTVALGNHGHPASAITGFDIAAITATASSYAPIAKGALIDSHIANTSNPHTTTAGQVGAYDKVSWGFCPQTNCVVGDTVAIPYIAVGPSTVVKCFIAAATAPTGTNGITIDIAKNGSSIFGGGTKLVLASGTSASTTTFVSPAIVEGDRLTAVITTVGGTTPGQNVAATCKLALP